MQLASIPGVFKTILIIVLVYYIFKYALRLFIAVKVKRSAGFRSQAEPKNEGDVTIEYIEKPELSSRRSTADADQVDFEEIEE